MDPTYLLAKVILKPWLRMWFRWTVEGLENIPKRGPAIIACNHIAYLDPLVLGFLIDNAGRHPRFLTKSELFQDRRIAWILRGAKQIEVRRGTKAAPMALEHALAALAEGECIAVFPEGTVTTDPDLKMMPARTGAARLALNSTAPVVPGALWGTQNVWPKGYGKNWRPTQRILARFGAPFVARGDPSAPRDWESTNREIADRISGLLAELRPLVPDRRRPAARPSGPLH